MPGYKRHTNARQNAVVVAAGLILRRGSILIGQRRAVQRHPLKWEFPGGKVEPGETPREALRRELREELDIEATVGSEIVRYEHAYRGRSPILLIFYRVSKYEGEVRNQVFEQLRWETPRLLSEYDFLDGDLDLIRRLGRGEYDRFVAVREPPGE